MQILGLTVDIQLNSTEDFSLKCPRFVPFSTNVVLFSTNLAAPKEIELDYKELAEEKMKIGTKTNSECFLFCFYQSRQ